MSATQGRKLLFHTLCWKAEQREMGFKRTVNNWRRQL